MSYKDFKTAFDAYLAANWTATDIIDTVNLPEALGRTDSWVTVTNSFIGDEGFANSASSTCVVSDVIMNIDIYTPSSSGDSAGIDLAETMNALFVGKRINSSIVWVESQGPQFGDDSASQGLWFRNRLVVYFEHRYKT